MTAVMHSISNCVLFSVENMYGTHFVLAHCTGYPASSYTIIAGDYNRNIPEGTEQIVGVVQLIMHPNYDT